jgi:hypothetical protein
MRAIELTKGLTTFVDDQDYERISARKWQATFLRGVPYAMTKEKAWNGQRFVSRAVYMHREVLGLSHGDKRQVDHCEPLSTLDNRRANLRLATVSRNMANRGKPKNNTSGFKGVVKNRNRFRAEIRVNRQKINLGSFGTPEEAHAAYSADAVKYFGEFARIS